MVDVSTDKRTLSEGNPSTANRLADGSEPIQIERYDLAYGTRYGLLLGNTVHLVTTEQLANLKAQIADELGLGYLGLQSVGLVP